MTTNIYDFSLDTSFGTIIMYFYSFDEDIKHKKMDILEKLIETHNGVYKLIFEIIFQNNKYKIDYDNTGFDELIKNPECIVSKLYVLKRSETKTNMHYYELNNNIKKYFDDNKDSTSINVDLNAKIKSYYEYDLNKEKLLLSKILGKTLKLNGIEVTKKASDKIFVSDDFDVSKSSHNFNQGKIIGNSLFVTISEDFIKDKLIELTDNQYPTHYLVLLQNLQKNSELLNNLWLEFEIEYMFF